MFNINFEIPTWSTVNNPFHFLDRQSDSLVITAGDSWTYGDSLGLTKVRNGVDDTEYRLNHIYGNSLSEKLNASWINIALPGISNFTVIDWVKSILRLKLKYNKIYCCITLTESGREAEKYFRIDRFNNQQQALDYILNYTYIKINGLRAEFPDVTFVVAHNFTDSLPDNTVEKSWIEVMLNKKIQNDTRIVVSEHIEQMNYQKNFNDKLEIIEKALKRIDLLDSCQYCFKEDSRHPNEDGHKLWAEYLFSQV